MKIPAAQRKLIRDKGMQSALIEHFGKGLFCKESDVETWIPTGSVKLDKAIGGGIPVGRITEIFSAEESHGKSTLAASIVKQAQAMGALCVLIDSEQSFLASYWKKLGVDTKKLVVINDQFTMETVFEIVDYITPASKPSEPVLVVWDSIAGTLTNRELKGEYDDEHYATQARVLSPALRKIAPVVSRKGCALVLINQSRMKIGVMFGNPNQTPGGKALKFWCHLRIALKRKKWRKVKSGKVTGIDVQAEIVKNKVGCPGGKAEFKIVFGRGVYDQGMKVGKQASIESETSAEAKPAVAEG